MSVTVQPVVSRRERQVGGCDLAAIEPDLTSESARAMAVTVKALADPTRLRIVDALRIASPEAICQCELTPLFEMSQQALSKHLKVLAAAGVVASERRGLWTYYHVRRDSLTALHAWLA